MIGVPFSPMRNQATIQSEAKIYLAKSSYVV